MQNLVEDVLDYLQDVLDKYNIRSKYKLHNDMRYVIGDSTQNHVKTKSILILWVPGKIYSDLINDIEKEKIYIESKFDCKLNITKSQYLPYFDEPSYTEDDLGYNIIVTPIKNKIETANPEKKSL
jgi:hypothetical protein